MKFEIANLAVAAVAAVGVAMGAMSARAADKDIVDTAVAAGQFNTLAAALTAAGLVEVMSADIAGKELEAKTVQGTTVAINATGDAVMVDGAKVVTADVEAKNGVIHVIDAVILPK